MGGGLMQLVAYGAQDIYLTGSPQITFFKVVYRRHTNFSMESIQQTWNGVVNAGNRTTATISRNGDLIHKMYLQVTKAQISASFNPGAKVCDEIELEIGGQRIDKQYGRWLETWAELTEDLVVPSQFLYHEEPTGNDALYKWLHPRGAKRWIHFHAGAIVTESGAHVVTHGSEFQKMTAMGRVHNASGLYHENASGGFTDINGSMAYEVKEGMNDLYIPLQFWFCRNPGLALPLIALQYHEVKVISKWDTALLGPGGSGTPNVDLWVDYIYLDTEERRRFAQVSHEYLIEQLQQQSVSTWAEAKSHDLHFNHPG